MIYNLIKNIQKHIAEQRIKHAPKPKGVAPPYQPPIIESVIKMQELELEHLISFEEIERYGIPKGELIRIAERELSVKFSEFINKNNLEHLVIEQHEWEEMYRFRAKLFIGINKRLFDKSIKSIESFKKDKTNKL